MRPLVIFIYSIIQFTFTGLVFVCGSRDGLMTVIGRKHNMDDIIATVLAVEPMKFIYRGRIAVFSVRVLRDERICIVAEQRPDCGEEEVMTYPHTRTYSRGHRRSANQ